MRKLLASALILLMTALSLNVGIAAHYCQGELAQMKLALGHGLATCGMEIEEKRDRNHNHIEAPPCCEDTYQQIGMDDVQVEFQKSEPAKAPTFAMPGLDALLQPTRLPSQISRPYHSPPVNTVQLPFVQVFRI